MQGAVFTAMVLRLGEVGLADFERALRSQIGRSPQFFAKAPVVLDLKESHGLTTAEDFLELKRLLRGVDLVPVGVQNANPAQQEAAAEAELGTFTGASAQRRANASQSTARAASSGAAKSLLVTEPVRSGTQLYARNADLIVLRSVSAGAEIIADGHIHVYGTLRGRAIAGATGDGEARIFVRRLEAELVSIAGRYLVRDEIAAGYIGQGAQILLQDERMVIVEN